MNTHNFAGNILIILGALIVITIASAFIFKLGIALFGIYLIFQGLKLKNQHGKLFFFFNRFTHR